MRLGRWLDCGASERLAGEADPLYREAAGAVRVRTGAQRLLRALHEHGLRTVILTNGTTNPQRDKVEATRLAGLVDAVVVSAEVGWHKPDAGAFLTALEAVGGRPEDAAMVGDDLEYDVDGALAAGFARVIWLARGRSHDDPRVTVVSRLDAVAAALGLASWSPAPAAA
jgi:putative hydrolase of the HAD superfamily